MQKNLYGGKFIVFEGLDGSGQSTQVKLLTEYFEKQGREVFLTKEPTKTTQAGKKIQSVLNEKKKIKPLQLQELFAQDRQEHLEKEIIPALKKGKIVISDRYFFSTLAFGGLNVPVAKLEKINDDFLYPDKIFFLKVAPTECVRRIIKRGEGVKFFEKLDKLKKVDNNYSQICLRFPDVEIINGQEKIGEIHRRIRSFFNNK